MIDLDDYEYQQDIALGVFGGGDEYDPTPMDQPYNEGDETAELFWDFWTPKEKDIDPRVYKGTHLEWSTLEEYRAVNPR